MGGVCKVIFMSNPTVVLRLGWGFDKKTFGLFEGTYKKFDLFHTLSDWIPPVIVYWESLDCFKI